MSSDPSVSTLDDEFEEIEENQGTDRSLQRDPILIDQSGQQPGRRQTDQQEIDRRIAGQPLAGKPSTASMSWLPQCSQGVSGIPISPSGFDAGGGYRENFQSSSADRTARRNADDDYGMRSASRNANGDQSANGPLNGVVH